MKSCPQKCRSRCCFDGTVRRRLFRGFSLVEVTAALVVLALAGSAVVTVVNRSVAEATDLQLRRQALDVARLNMEELLSGDSVAETVEYGSSDIYPGIEYQNVVEAFYEPITSRMWIKATCAADYTDSDGEIRTVELTHWLTDLTRQQMLQIIERKQARQEQMVAAAEGEQDSLEPDQRTEGIDNEEETGIRSGEETLDKIRQFDPETMDITVLMDYIRELFGS